MVLTVEGHKRSWPDDHALHLHILEVQSTLCPLLISYWVDESCLEVCISFLDCHAKVSWHS
jgi:hypothetical protein